MQACVAAGLVNEEQNWAAFASNVGRARIERREAVEFRIRWLGALTMLILVAAAGFLMVRYYGLRAGWWPSFLPPNPALAKLDGVYLSLKSWVTHIFA
jgi:hypothetical protein